MRKNVRGICKETQQTVTNAKSEYEGNAEEFSEKFRDQNQGHNINMSIIRDQYNKLTRIHSTKMDGLKERVEKDD